MASITLIAPVLLAYGADSVTLLYTTGIPGSVFDSAHWMQVDPPAVFALLAPLEVGQVGHVRVMSYNIAPANKGACPRHRNICARMQGRRKHVSTGERHTVVLGAVRDRRIPTIVLVASADCLKANSGA